MATQLRTTGLQGVTDLTVLAPIKQGLVPDAFRNVSYVERLKVVLAAINAVRQALRESALQPSPFADLIGNFRGIHFFRFAVIPPRTPGTEHQLLLNVTFDGGWEPYMRIIWGPLGTLLDLVFCHCKDYPLAWFNSFDSYMAWVRANEVESNFFFSDSAATVADTHYLRLLEEKVRSDGGASGADLAACGVALSARPPAAIPGVYAVGSSLRVLKLFHDFREQFPNTTDPSTRPPSPQDALLLRFTQDLLRDLHQWNAQGLFDPGRPFDQIGAVFRLERQWLMLPTAPRTQEPERRPVLDRGDIQVGIDAPYPDGSYHGVLVLLRITAPAAARTWLRAFITTTTSAAAAAAMPPPAICRSIAITYAGLQRFGVPQPTLDLLPREFREGMEVRAGILGDLRANHPDAWRRPRRNWPQVAPPVPPAAAPPPPALELSTVHLLVQLRTDQLPGFPGPGGLSIPPNLVPEIDALGAAGTGLDVLFVQPMKSRAPRPGEPAAPDAFGFADGISQPTLKPELPPRAYWSDQVRTGDLFLGYGNSRDDGPLPVGDVRNALLDNGSFLVVRKLRQHPQRLDALVAAAAARLRPNDPPAAQAAFGEVIRSKLVGRRSDGTPLVAPPGGGYNDFDYRNDARGAQCPFQAHIRRANPRERLPLKLPARIARRGMSYQDGAEQGLIFMAYNASIAEQFEVIQRWLSGANSSGLSSEQSDPLLGVPEAGRRRIYRFEHAGEVMRVDLGADPLVTLEWGLYAFAPSLTALKEIESGTILSPALPKGPAPPPPAADPMVAMLDDEDPLVRARAWTEVRTSHGGLHHLPGYGLLVGDKGRVLATLKDKGNNFSAVGYGDRMESTIGRGFLGMDDVGQHAGHAVEAPGVNAALESINEAAAFDLAFKRTQTRLNELWAGAVAFGGSEAQVNLVELSRTVIARLCSDWFGLPDAAAALMVAAPPAQDAVLDNVARCPAHLLAVSRYVFSPRPANTVKNRALAQGPLVKKAVLNMLQQFDMGIGNPTPLVAAIRAALGSDLERQASTIGGAMLGFAPTVIANLVPVLFVWTESRALWTLQQTLLSAAPAVSYVSADAVLRSALLSTMVLAPSPNAVWRTAMQAGALGVAGCPVRETVVLGLSSALQDGGDPVLLFGGSRAPNHPAHTLHACPGYKMAVGVMLGCAAALMAAGSLRATPDRRVLMLSKL
ncbi:Dyp-type peroxidase domain-containing protein [Rivibacter subsaxonicus]|uniref:Deferrochelatase/peroxidase EfeB n=1 Tax=Rivibacter subsaxonicus TaxID=457575 RepID=A0A4Q7W164_9BURK|nr:Dyp-type peroxidase domain-containing protein [Rivibacter subsaxonicus]RZU02947.1 deferrochelatase/peroxidase EfeB [Rivibacter subsaxonicus]